MITKSADSLKQKLIKDGNLKAETVNVFLGGGKKYKIISEIERKPNCQRRKLRLEFINQKLQTFLNDFRATCSIWFLHFTSISRRFFLSYLRNYIL